MASPAQFDLVTLRLFVAVCEEHSINRAAEREHIAASALSRRLSELEAYFKLSLFRRHARGLEPTPAGVALLHHVRILLRDMAQMESELTDHASGLKGTVKLHANVWSIVQYLPEQLNSFLSQHPLVNIEIEEALSAATVKAVAGRQADIGIIGSNVAALGLNVIPFRRDRLVVVMTDGHPLSGRDRLRLVDLLPYDFIGSKRGSAIDDLILRGLTEIGATLKTRIRVSGPETLCRMVQAQMGIGLVPVACAERHRESMRLAIVPFDEPWAWRELNICVPHGDLPRHVRMLVEHLRPQD